MLNKKIHILYICSMDSNHSKRWISAFIDFGYNVTVLNISDTKNDNFPGCKIIDVNFFSIKLFNFIMAYFIMIFRINQSSIDIFHIHYLGYNLIPAMAVKSSKLVLTAWGSDIFLAQHNRIRAWLLGRSLRVASLITGDSQTIINQIAKLNVNKNKIHRINFGTETDFYKARKPERININLKTLNIISLRNLEPIYNIECLIEAVKILHDKGFNLNCDIFGYGSLEDNLKNLIKQYSLEKVIKLCGRFDAKLLPKTFSKYDLYVSTSTSDAGISASTAEAMSCEVPVLISDSAENSSWVENGVNGLLYKTSNQNELAQQLIKFSDFNESKRLSVGLAGRETIIKHNDCNTEMSKMSAIITQLVNT